MGNTPSKQAANINQSGGRVTATDFDLVADTLKHDDGGEEDNADYNYNCMPVASLNNIQKRYQWPVSLQSVGPLLQQRWAGHHAPREDADALRDVDSTGGELSTAATKTMNVDVVSVVLLYLPPADVSNARTVAHGWMLAFLSLAVTGKQVTVVKKVKSCGAAKQPQPKPQYIDDDDTSTTATGKKKKKGKKKQVSTDGYKPPAGLKHFEPSSGGGGGGANTVDNNNSQQQQPPSSTCKTKLKIKTIDITSPWLEYVAHTLFTHRHFLPNARFDKLVGFYEKKRREGTSSCGLSGALNRYSTWTASDTSPTQLRHVERHYIAVGEHESAPKIQFGAEVSFHRPLHCQDASDDEQENVHREHPSKNIEAGELRYIGTFGAGDVKIVSNENHNVLLRRNWIAVKNEKGAVDWMSEEKARLAEEELRRKFVMNDTAHPKPYFFCCEREYALRVYMDSYQRVGAKKRVPPYFVNFNVQPTIDHNTLAMLMLQPTSSRFNHHSAAQEEVDASREVEETEHSGEHAKGQQRSWMSSIGQGLTNILTFGGPAKQSLLHDDHLINEHTKVLFVTGPSTLSRPQYYHNEAQTGCIVEVLLPTESRSEMLQVPIPHTAEADQREDGDGTLEVDGVLGDCEIKQPHKAVQGNYVLVLASAAPVMWSVGWDNMLVAEAVIAPKAIVYGHPGQSISGFRPRDPQSEFAMFGFTNNTQLFHIDDLLPVEDKPTHRHQTLWSQQPAAVKQQLHQLFGNNGVREKNWTCSVFEHNAMIDTHHTIVQTEVQPSKVIQNGANRKRFYWQPDPSRRPVLYEEKSVVSLGTVRL